MADTKLRTESHKIAGTQTFACILCNETLQTKELLQEHFRDHANNQIDLKGKKKIKCSNDIKNDDTQSNPTNEESEKIPCDVCAQTFETVSQAIQHKFRRHPDNVSKHYCDFCGMQFPLKHTHDKHILVHRTEKAEGSFACEECSATFVTKRGCSYHTKSAHKRISSFLQPVNTPPPSKKIRINNANEAQSVYYCYLCGAEYMVKFNLQKHLENSHTAAERDNPPSDLIKCKICDALFYNKRAYDSHSSYHKPDDLYVTSEEQRLQTVSRVDQDFDIRRVQFGVDKFIPRLKVPKRQRATNVKTGRVKRKNESDNEISPTSELSSSDDELKIKEPVESVRVCNKISEKIKSEHPNKAGVFIKKRLYAIIDANGQIKETRNDIPKNGVLAKSDIIKIKNSDILKTLKKPTTIPVKLNMKPETVEGTVITNPPSIAEQIETNIKSEISAQAVTGINSKILKIILDRLPEEYENVLKQMKAVGND